MNKEDIRQRVFNIVEGLRTPWASTAEVTDSANLRDDLALESIDFLDLVLQTETMFHIKISPEEAKDLQLVSDVTAIVEKKMS
jgi:acyl carrier protein